MSETKIVLNIEKPRLSDIVLAENIEIFNNEIEYFQKDLNNSVKHNKNFIREVDNIEKEYNIKTGVILG